MYRVGIDVGRNSVGFCALEVDGNSAPLRLLAMNTIIHDAGVDPDAQKTAETRLATSGLARRMRRAKRQRRKRLRDVENLMEELGWPILDVPQADDTNQSWENRAELATFYIEDDDTRKQMLVSAVRHIARHRGWRSPWQRAEALSIQDNQIVSEQYLELHQRVQEKLAVKDLPEGLTVGQLVWCLLQKEAVNLRKKKTAEKSGTIPLLPRLMQSDQARELRIIGEVQRLDEGLIARLIHAVFAAKTPRGSANERVGRDPLPGQKQYRRAPKAHPVFQEYRILSVVANMRVKMPNGEEKSLDQSQRDRVVDLLMTWEREERPSWADVADVLGLERHNLRGTAYEFEDGETVAARPPINAINEIIRACKVRDVREAWRIWTPEQQGRFISQLVGDLDIDIPLDGEESDDEIVTLLRSLTESDLDKLDAMRLPAGRAAYSIESLEIINKEMRERNCGVYEALHAAFGITGDWKPPAEPISAPLGHPAVDRVLKIVNRWILMAEQRWGVPIAINIEHVRDGAVPEKQAREIMYSYNISAKENEKISDQLKGLSDSSGIQLYPAPSSADIRRYRALQRQNGECLYCGAEITLSTAEMDHIVPRKGEGSSNRRENLVAVCRDCNRDKSNQLFSVWVAKCGREGVSSAEALRRINFWIKDPDWNASSFRAFKKAVAQRIRQKQSDEPIDARSMESVAWMAKALAHRIEAHFSYCPTHKVSVRVYRGALTSEARRGTRFRHIEMIGGRGKHRMDRRHHAIDAAVISMMRHSVAETLAIRSELRRNQEDTGSQRTWKEFVGRDFAAQKIYAQWLEHMSALAQLCQEALNDDMVTVHNYLRLRPAVGAIHEATITPLVYKKLGDKWTREEIDRVASGAMWVALTHDPCFVWKTGKVELPIDPERRIRVNGTEYRAEDLIPLFPSKSPQIVVRGGAVSIGNSIHHVRIYRVREKAKSRFYMMRVFASDLKRARREDVFAWELPQYSASMRDAHINLRIAIREGKAEYLGWLVRHDEIELGSLPEMEGVIGEYYRVLPETKRWKITGYEDSSKLTLKPIYISGEELSSLDRDAKAWRDEGGRRENVSPPVFSCEDIAAISKVVSSRGWRVAVNSLFKDYGVININRRDAHGRVRRYSYAGHLPVSWCIED
ncbi:type II CRISPR RNA-guided endonuclease Cas9 [Trueperella sp. LYQ141]|uniref:type II CRISPR RNA-guided endonuclease Cas9 n=1 Tax=Trueperella sp. LYQ141 TaxID=3391058 RepID=UPI003983BD4E